MSHSHSQVITETNEKKTLIVIILTLVTMFAEVFYGHITHSMALLADGFHMGTHALALGLTYVAYILARIFADSCRFPNGTDKIKTLAGYTSSIFLGFTALWIIYEAINRLIHTQIIQFNEAIIVAIIGLTVNLICIFVMEKGHQHTKKNHHQHNHETPDVDYNFKAAYFHILADALTSIFAIFALVFGKFFHVMYLDSCVGILGGILILTWTYNLLKETIKILIDMKC